MTGAIERLEALERSATPGPWMDSPGFFPDSEPDLYIERSATWEDPVDGVETVVRAAVIHEASIPFIVAIRNAAPAILKVLRAAKEWSKTGSPGDRGYGLTRCTELREAVKEMEAL